MEKLLEGKVAIVTGGGSGIGEAICKKFAKHGAKVIVCGFHEDPVDNVVGEIKDSGGEAISYKGDMAIEEQAKGCVDFALRTYGKLDVLINNAGVFPETGPVQDFSVDAFNYLIKNNIQSALLMTKYAIPELQKTKGCIVSAGSEAGMDGEPEVAAYAGTKGFVHAFTKSVAVEQAKYGVRANIVAPGPVDTSWMRITESPMTMKQKGLFKSAIPIGRFGKTEEVANVYLFLASDLSSFVTGAEYKVDGGLTIGKGPMGLMADDALKEDPEGELELHHEHEGHAQIRH
ncbi:SDR family oxidoreductase [Cytophagaceae bacterium ABcell3]|nr:SDR family oxidoreductase [Cytophagaceae bacterium ABcell3]